MVARTQAGGRMHSHRGDAVNFDMISRSAWTAAGAVALALALGTVGARRARAQASADSVRAIPSLDLQRYAGLWYEVARLPNRFERQCVGEVTASYELHADSTITVVNSCRTAEGSASRAEGKAKLAGHDDPTSKLKVRFAPGFLSFLPFVWADYWVLDLTDDYSTALVGTPDHKYLWVLSRTAVPDSAAYDRMIATAAREGFDVARLQRVGTP